MLYTALLYPLERLMELLFSLSAHVFKGTIALSLLSLSVLVSLLTLPLYAVAEKWQEVEAAAARALEPDIKHIKTAFASSKGFTADERYMLTSTLYRQAHYHPIMALRSSLALVIMVPFFMAAYHFLSHLGALQGQSFLFIRDLGQPDRVFTAGRFYVNILPIAMTLINIISGAIYLRGHTLREKVQTYGLAAVFLVLLYNSPAGLVVYWTMNNIFSLVKNVFYRLKRPLVALYICIAAAVCGIDCYLLFVHRGNIKKRLLMAAILSLVLLAPLAVKAARRVIDKCLTHLVEDGKKSAMLYILSCLSLWVLVGAVLPGLVISSSVVEFNNIDGLGSPVLFVNNAFAQSAGLFLLWPLGVYFLFSRRVRAMLATLAAVGALCALSNAFLFTAHYGTLTRLMTFSDNIAGATKLSAIVGSAAVSIIIAVAVVLLIRRGWTKVITSIAAILLCSTVTAGVWCSVSINKEVAEIASQDAQGGKIAMTEVTPLLHFTPTGRNVVLFMLDRAESAYFHGILQRRPDIARALDGFVYYPNTVSYGGHTIFGAPPLYGGYEYTPLEMNRRADTPLVTKNNEALLVLPRIFTETAGFDATVTDLSWANYSWIADMSICDPYPAIRPLALERTYTAQWMAEHPDMVEPFVLSRTIKRNLIYVSVFRILWPLLREPFYDEGRWWTPPGENQTGGEMNEFIDYYSALYYLPHLTAADATGDQYFTIVNETTHQRCPAVIAQTVGEKDEDAASNVVALAAIAKWLDALKDMGVYDNTRIIIAADHGSGHAGGPMVDGTDYSADNLHPLLLVKDFGAHGAVTADDAFMTNADVPAMLLDGVVESPANPFTGQAIDNRMKDEGVIVTVNKNWTPGKQGRTKFSIQDDQWYRVTDGKGMEYERYSVK